MRRGWIVTAIAAVIAVGMLPGLLMGLSTDRLVVTDLALVSSVEVNAFYIDETYKARVRHVGAPGENDFAAVTAQVSHLVSLLRPGALRIVDGDITFGSVRAGETVESRDTVTFRRLRSFALNLGDIRWFLSARPDLVLPDEWAGTWRVTMTTRDPATDQIAAVDEITDSIGSGEAIGFSLMPPIVQCRWISTELLLQADCRTRIKRDPCILDATAHVSVARDANAMTGHGQWDLIATGDCGAGDAGGGGLIEIDG